MISESVLNFLMEISVLSFIFPMVILLTWRLRTRKNLLPALAGALIFLLFAKLLEAIPYALFVGFENPISKIVRSNEVVYALYQGVMAAIFEETGRFLAFRYFLNGEKFHNRQTAITYGIGHGGVECMIVLGWTNLQYYATGVIINQEKILEEKTSELQQIISQMQDFTVFSCVLNAVSGVLFFVLQIALSIMVYQAYRNENLGKRLLGYAMGLHLLSYLPGGLYHAGLIPQLISVILTGVVMGIALFFAAGIYHRMGVAEKEQQAVKQQRKSSAPENNWSVARQKFTNLEEKDK